MCIFMELYIVYFLKSVAAKMCAYPYVPPSPVRLDLECALLPFQVTRRCTITTVF